MRHIWIIGSNGLLGSALVRSLKLTDEHIFSSSERLFWADEVRLLAQLGIAVREFSESMQLGDTWEVYWAAGVGTLASPVEELRRETTVLGCFLSLLEQQEILRRNLGTIAFASSAGAIYAGVTNEVITEQTQVAPTTPYAHAKLQQEALVRDFNDRNEGTRSLIARISTLYGAGQSSGKKQGLLTHIARSVVRNKPIQIYVPFDTIRDYITANDAAVRIVTAVRRNLEDVRHQTLIVASENPSTIAEIIAIFKRVSRRTPRVVTSVSRNTSLYNRRIQFCSTASSELKECPRTSLLVGIGELLQSERLSFATSKPD